MPPDDRADLYNRLPEERREDFMPALAQVEREDIRRLAAYPERSVGSVMTSDYATLPADLDVRRSIEHLRKIAPDAEIILQIVAIVGSVIGMSLPFLLSRFRLDPATASAPLITSIAGRPEPHRRRSAITPFAHGWTRNRRPSWTPNTRTTSQRQLLIVRLTDRQWPTCRNRPAGDARPTTSERQDKTVALSQQA